jgi:hypothetical protein
LLLFRPRGGGGELRQHFLKLLFDIAVGYDIHLLPLLLSSARPFAIVACGWLRNVRSVFRDRPPHMHSVRVIDVTAGSQLLCVTRLTPSGEPARKMLPNRLGIVPRGAF